MIHERTEELTANADLYRMINYAKRNGSLQRLYWFIEVMLPGHLTRSGKPVVQAACWPSVWTPEISVGLDPEVSRCWAEILMEMFVQGNADKGIERKHHALSLTIRERMEGLDWYEFGSTEFDCVCADCGAVFRDMAPDAEYSCCGDWRD